METSEEVNIILNASSSIDILDLQEAFIKLVSKLIDNVSEETKQLLRVYDFETNMLGLQLMFSEQGLLSVFNVANNLLDEHFYRILTEFIYVKCNKIKIEHFNLI